MFLVAQGQRITFRSGGAAMITHLYCQNCNVTCQIIIPSKVHESMSGRGEASLVNGYQPKIYALTIWCVCV